MALRRVSAECATRGNGFLGHCASFYPKKLGLQKIPFFKFQLPLNRSFSTSGVHSTPLFFFVLDLELWPFKVFTLFCPKTLPCRRPTPAKPVPKFSLHLPRHFAPQHTHIPPPQPEIQAKNEKSQSRPNSHLAPISHMPNFCIFVDFDVQNFFETLPSPTPSENATFVL